MFPNSLVRQLAGAGTVVFSAACFQANKFDGHKDEQNRGNAFESVNNGNKFVKRLEHEMEMAERDVELFNGIFLEPKNKDKDNWTHEHVSV